MPAVNYDLMLQEMLTKTTGKVNQVLYWSRPLDWHNQTLTPNPDAIYFMAFFNTKDAGPIVLEVPPRATTARSTATSSTSGRCRWRTPARPGPTRARRQLSDPAARLHRRVPDGLYRAAARHVRQLRAAALEPEEPQRRRCRQIGRLRQEDQSLSALAGGQSAGDHFTDAADVLFDSTIRYDASFFSLARPHRAERAVARPRPGDDRSC